MIDNKFSPDFPMIGKVLDMEKMNLESKLSHLRNNESWKCMNRKEVIKEHSSTWKSNGLNNLQYKEISREWLNEFSIKIVVDVLLNNHWTDSTCGENDKQY